MLLQLFNKFLYFQYSGWSVNNKDKYLAAQVTFKVQSRTETIVELRLDQQQQEVVKYVSSPFPASFTAVVLLQS